MICWFWLLHKIDTKKNEIKKQITVDQWPSRWDSLKSRGGKEQPAAGKVMLSKLSKEGRGSIRSPQFLRTPMGHQPRSGNEANGHGNPHSACVTLQVC